MKRRVYEYEVPVDVELRVLVFAKDAETAKARAEEIVYERINKGTVQIDATTTFEPALTVEVLK